MSRRASPNRLVAGITAILHNVETAHAPIFQIRHAGEPEAHNYDKIAEE